MNLFAKLQLTVCCENVTPRSGHCAKLSFLAIETYAQALAWLGASESMSDDYIIPLLALKVSCFLYPSTTFCDSCIGLLCVSGTTKWAIDIISALDTMHGAVLLTDNL